MFRYANIFMAVTFFLCVVVQYDDPDPIRWMTVYGLAALVCVAFVFGRFSRVFASLLGAVALVWALSLIPAVIGQVSIAEIFGSVHMIDTAVEEAREALGLLIVALWMAALLWRSLRAVR